MNMMVQNMMTPNTIQQSFPTNDTEVKQPMEKLVYTVNELAQVLNIGMNSAYCLVNSTGFPRLIVGRKILIPKKALETWMISTSISTK